MFRKFTGEYTKEISMPLGGIGAGCIGLAGNGGLIDWEIFNRPNKCSDNGFSHFAVKAEKDGCVLDARVLEGDVYSDYTGRPSGGYGSGMPQTSMSGFPHFKDCVFHGAYPTAEITFADDKFPGKVSLGAFSVMIPQNDRDSSIPAAIFRVTVSNDSSDELLYTAALTVRNPWQGSVNTAVEGESFTAMRLTQTARGRDEIGYGDLTFAAKGGKVSAQRYWYRGGWNDHLESYWRNFNAPGAICPRDYDSPGNYDHATLAVELKAARGESVSADFVITWNCPNLYNYWSPYKVKDENGVERDYIWHNYYTSLFADSFECASYVMAELERLRGDTYCFRDAVFTSSLPEEVKEAAMSALAVLKSPTVLRFENGDIYGWEGVWKEGGSCEGCCTHVWNYAYAMAFLFPSLERNLRENDFKYNQSEDGKMSFRALLPYGRGKWGFRACVDGQMGGVIKTYREWKLCGDSEWLRGLWPAVKKSLEYAWSPSNPDRWDADRDGVLEGRQHHTLDMELFGPSSWLEGFYLAALKAGAEMADEMDDDDFATLCRELFAKGSAFTESELWNGEYYCQTIDLNDRGLLSGFEGADGEYWNSETNEIKYQLAEGCEIDQLCAQWHANVCGLGDIFDPDKRKTALRSLYKYNFLPTVRDHFNPFRLYAVNDEAAAIMCVYPPQAKTPSIPLPYAQESMHGFEYQLAALMISEGMEDEGLEIVRAVRARYDGKKRNPYNEIECGSNYARSMASWSLIPLMSGFTFDLSEGNIGFEPKTAVFKGFWSCGGAWGVVYVDTPNSVLKLDVYGGTLTLSSITLPFEPIIIKIRADSTLLDITTESNTAAFKNPARITCSLTVER